MKKGIYITNVWYTRFNNHATGDFSTIPRDGAFYVENGEIKHALKDVRISDNLLRMMKNISLVIIDSFTKYYRVKLSDKIVIKPITMRMLRMLKGLRVPVILTSQVYEMDDKVKPVGSDLFYKFADYEIYLEYKDEQRTLVKGKERIPFVITNKGLE